MGRSYRREDWPDARIRRGGAGMRARARLKARRRHTCSACDTVFLYEIEGNGQAEAPSEDQARQQAHALALKDVNETVIDHPCPGCGAYQGEMLGKVAMGNGCLAWLPLLLALLMLILSGFDAVSNEVVSWVSFACMAVTTVGLFRVSRSDPNGDLAKNLAFAQKQVA